MHPFFLPINNIMANTFNIQDLSLLSPNKFQLVIHKFGETAFWATDVKLPDIEIGVTKQNTSTNLNWWQPGDKIVFEDLSLNVIIDENMIAYRKLKEWMDEITRSDNFPASFSDLTVIILTNNSNQNITFKFKDAFPWRVSSPLLSTEISEDSPLVSSVVFKFTSFDILPSIGTIDSTT